ncbi:MAG: 30S ribosomal protein S17 [Planctomycetota bacterium]|jgi:small subunit ribosomal protein S17|nr:30S ribosomal protein S17 [Planctomycetota bacterium]
MSAETVETKAGLTRSNRRTLAGVVKAAKTAKTIRVTVTRDFKHPKYEKRVRRTRNYVVHDEKGEAKPGDMVEIMETRKLSKTKNWRLIGILKRVE